MADEEVFAMDPQKTINDVVNSVKSEGLFDQFRKECLEEFDNMETYNQLKQTVENHVASFLSKHRFNEKLQKNALRGELRNHLNKSEVLLNGTQRLVDEVLSLKGHGFCLKIDKQVDKFLNPVTDNVTDLNQSGSATTLENSEPGILLAVENEVKANMETIVNEVTEIEEVEMEIESNSSDSPKQVHPTDNEARQSLQPTEIISSQSEDKITLSLVTEKENLSCSDVKKQEQLPERLKSLDNELNNLTSETTAKHEPLEHELSENIIQLKKQSEEKPETQKLNDKKTDDLDCHKENLEQQKCKDEEKIIPEANTKTEDNKTVLRDSSEQGDISTQENRDLLDSEKSNPEEEKVKSQLLKACDDNKPPTSSGSCYLSSLQTEPISDESTSNSTDSFEQISEASDNDGSLENVNEENEAELLNLRKSHRKRTVPMKFREDDEDDTTITKTTVESESSKSTKSSRGRVSSRDRAQDTKHESVEPNTRGRPTSRRKEHETSIKSKRKRSLSKDKRNRSSSRRSRSRHETRSKSNSKTSSPEERFSKRPRRPTKQRERYSPT